MPLVKSIKNGCLDSLHVSVQSGLLSYIMHKNKFKQD